MNINDLPPEIISHVLDSGLDAVDLWTLARRVTREQTPLGRAAQENGAWMKHSPDALVSQVLAARKIGQAEPSLLLAFEGRLKHLTPEAKKLMAQREAIDSWEAHFLPSDESSHFDLVLGAARAGADTTLWMGRGLFSEPQIIGTILSRHGSLAEPLMPPEMSAMLQIEGRPGVESLQLFRDDIFWAPYALEAELLEVADTSLYEAFLKRWSCLDQSVKTDILGIYRHSNSLSAARLPNDISDNFDYVMARCWLKGDAASVASARLRDESAIGYLATGTGDGHGFALLSPRLRGQELIARRAVAQNGLNIGLTSDALRDHYDLARLACLKDPECFDEVSDRLQRNATFVVDLMQHSTRVRDLHALLPEELQHDERVLTAYRRRVASLAVLQRNF